MKVLLVKRRKSISLMQDMAKDLFAGGISKTSAQNLPLPPCERILPMQDGYWSMTKHGSDMKMQAGQSMSVPLLVDAPGAKVAV
jgi:hypothetical protein